MKINTKYIPYVCLVFFSCLLISGSYLSLWDQDEAAYAGMARQMVESGNWIIPEFMWSDVHRKPPLHLWNIAVCYKLFGINEFSVRFSSILFSLLTYWMVYRLALLITNMRIAIAAMVISATTLLIPMLGRIAFTDATLLFFSTWASFCVFQYFQKPSWKWVLMFWCAFAAALLTKGPPIIIFSGILVVLLIAVHPERKKLIGFHPWFFLPLACVPFIWWAFSTYRYDNGKMIDWMVNHYILKRINDSVFGQTGPPGTHVLFILFSFFPYLIYLPGAIKLSVQEFIARKKESVLLCSWFVAAWLIYEFSPSKLPSYTVMAHIPLILIIARYLFSDNVPNRLTIYLHYALNSLLFITIIAVPFFLNFPDIIKFSWTVSGSFLFLLQLITWMYSKKKFERFLFAVCGIAMIFQIVISLVLLPSMELIKLKTKEVALATQEAMESSCVLIGNNTGHPPSLPFYLYQRFSGIKEEFYVSEWMAAYYDSKPFVLILQKNQFTPIDSLIPTIEVKKITSYQLEKLNYFDYYVVINPSSKGQNPDAFDIITTTPPIPPVPIEQHIANIKKDALWLNDVKRKAKEQKVSLEKMIILDAKFLFEQESAVYEFELRIRKSKRWLNSLLEKAKKNNISLEKMIHIEAVLLINKRNIE